MKEGEEETTEFVTPGEVLGNFSDFKPGRGAYVANNTVYASLSGFRRIIPPPLTLRIWYTLLLLFTVSVVCVIF